MGISNSESNSELDNLSAVFSIFIIAFCNIYFYVAIQKNLHDFDMLTVIYKIVIIIVF